MDTSRLPTYLRDNSNNLASIATLADNTAPHQKIKKKVELGVTQSRSFKTEFDTNFTPLPQKNYAKISIRQQKVRLQQLYHCKQEQQAKIKKIQEIKNVHSEFLEKDDLAKIEYVYNDLTNVLAVAEHEITEIQNLINKHKSHQNKIYEKLSNDLANVDRSLSNHFQAKLSHV